MHFFSSKKLTTFFLVVSLKTQRPLTTLRLFHCQNKTNKAVNAQIWYNFYFLFTLLPKQSSRQGGARAVDLPFDLVHPGVALRVMRTNTAQGTATLMRSYTATGTQMELGREQGCGHVMWMWLLGLWLLIGLTSVFAHCINAITNLNGNPNPNPNHTVEAFILHHLLLKMLSVLAPSTVTLMRGYFGTGTQMERGMKQGCRQGCRR